MHASSTVHVSRTYVTHMLRLVRYAAVRLQLTLLRYSSDVGLKLVVYSVLYRGLRRKSLGTNAARQQAWERWVVMMDGPQT